MLRLTETRGSRSWPAAFQASRIRLDLLALLDVERLAGLVELQRRALQVHAELGRPHGGRVRARRPTRSGRAGPASAARRRSSPGGFGNIGRGFGSAKPSPLRTSRKTSVWLARHVGVGLALGRHVAEVAEPVDHLLRRAAADPELEPAAGDEVGGAGVLGHVQRVLVAHVDDRGADLDAAGPRADRGEQRERRAELLGEVVDAEVRAVGAELLGGHGQLDRLDAGRRRPSAPASTASPTNGRTTGTRSSSWGRF